MINLTKEMAEELIAQANKHSEKVVNLYEVASLPMNHTLYIKGVRDGVENTSYSSFMAGAKAMLTLLNKKDEQTD